MVDVISCKRRLTYFSHCSFFTVHSIRNDSSSHTPIYTHKHPYTHGHSLTFQPLHQTLVRDGLLWAVLQSLQRNVQHSAAQQFKSAVCGKTNNSWTSVIRSVKVIHTSNTKYSISSHPSCHSSFLLLQTANPSHIIVLCMLVKWINTRAWKGNTIKVYCYAFMPVWHVSAITNCFYDCCSFSLWLLQYLLLLPCWISNRCLLQLL